MRLILDGPNSPEYNMAADECLYILHSGGAAPPTVRIWELDRSAVMLGKYSRLGENVRAGELASLGIPAIRRFTGGGVTYNDFRGDLGWTYVSAGENTVGKYREAAGAISHALSHFGLRSEFDPYGGLYLPEGKISGISGARSGSTVLVHGTFLFRPDLEIMDRVLKPYHRRDGVTAPAASFVAPLDKILGRSVGLGDIVDAMVDGFRNLGTLEAGRWTRMERDLAARLEERYHSDAWNLRY